MSKKLKIKYEQYMRGKDKWIKKSKELMVGDVYTNVDVGTSTKIRNERRHLVVAVVLWSRIRKASRTIFLPSAHNLRNVEVTLV